MCQKFEEKESGRDTEKSEGSGQTDKCVSLTKTYQLKVKEKDDEVLEVIEIRTETEIVDGSATVDGCKRMTM